jgi:hypothetical protein
VIAGENPEKAIDLALVPKERPESDRGQGRRRAGEESRETVSLDSDDAQDREVKKLRAINRAPEPIADLYRRDLISKGTAVALGTTKRDTSPTKARAELALFVRFGPISSGDKSGRARHRRYMGPMRPTRLHRRVTLSRDALDRAARLARRLTGETGVEIDATAVIATAVDRGLEIIESMPPPPRAP